MAECENQLILGLFDILKDKIMDLWSNDAETYAYDFDALVGISNVITDIEREVACIESERDRQKEQASKLRKILGNQLNDLCDKAGIE